MTPLKPRTLEDFLHPPQPLIPRVHEDEQEQSSLPLATTLHRLSATLSEALAFFIQLERSFCAETRPISGYTKTTELDQIWKSKVVAVAAKDGLAIQKQTSWFRKFWTILVKERITSTPNITLNANTNVTTYIKRIEKDLLEAIHAHWPPGIKTGLDHSMLSNPALISLSYLYDRMTGLASRLQDEVVWLEIHRMHSRFRAFVREVELVQIEMEQGEEYWL